VEPTSWTLEEHAASRTARSGVGATGSFMARTSSPRAAAGCRDSRREGVGAPLHDGSS
jgi:hypothetical protein